MVKFLIYHAKASSTDDGYISDCFMVNSFFYNYQFGMYKTVFEIKLYYKYLYHEYYTIYIRATLLRFIKLCMVKSMLQCIVIF